ncbi:hypothetical protein EXIGLDRAFT_769305 [Exidia glandulosa HHB12029]|uniref:F-box domain-containing protein n=1 Tax=Exidia glandulosa HHB12029 TaxID=1314781 RepID=A0A165HKW7_EXIGL|nr:hypothetical protein EXIGLDRAFT_769305 [Exidia glandulosa HHB12029]
MAVLAVIDSIPNELLSTILRSARPHAFHLARSITLSHVCTRWRAVVLGDAQMWDSISLDDSDHRIFPQQGKLCLRAFLDVVSIILARSRDAPLYLDLGNEPSDSTTLTRLVPLLLPNVHRIVDLCLEVCDPSDLMTILRGGLSFPELRKLSLNVMPGVANFGGEPAQVDMDMPVASVVALFGIIPSDIKRFFSPFSLSLKLVWVEVSASSLATDLSNALLSCPILTDIGIAALPGVPLLHAEHVPSTTSSHRKEL